MQKSKAQITLSSGACSTFEGSEYEVLSEVFRFAQSKLKQLQPAPGESATEGWNTQSIWHLMRHVAPGPRKLLVELAKKPNGYPLPDLKLTLDLSGNDIGGQLGSVTRHALNLFPEKPKFVKRDASTDYEFRMNEELALAILEFKD